MRALRIAFWLYSKLPKIICRILSDEIELTRYYYRYYNYFPDLINPKTFDEKIQWFKLNYRKPIMNKMADKYAVRKYVESLGLGKYLNTLYGVYDNVEDIKLDTLPSKFILKATHGCGMNIVCTDKNKLDWNKTKKQLRKWLKVNYFYLGRSWAYKDIKPRIICEKLLEPETDELVDYKIYCFNGIPKAIDIYSGRNSENGIQYDAYDMNWNFISIKNSNPGYLSEPVFDVTVLGQKIQKELIFLAGKLSQNLLFSRIDFYVVKSKIVFGEITFYPGNGLSYMKYPERDAFLANMFELPKDSQLKYQ